jgi:succinate dehydrogenase / fumarate reductase membrane anchor subunit
VTLLALVMHAWVGVRDIWMDYVKPVGVRLTLHVLTILWLVSCFIYSVKVVWGL